MIIGSGNGSESYQQCTTSISKLYITKPRLYKVESSLLMFHLYHPGPFAQADVGIFMSYFIKCFQEEILTLFWHAC